MATSSPVTDEQRLHLFCGLVDRAVQRRAIQERTISAKWNIKLGGPGAPMTVTSDLGDEEDAQGLMLPVRQLLMNGEPTQFYAIANIVERVVVDDELRESNRVNRDSWKRLTAGEIVLQTSAGRSYRGVELFELYAYGGVFHSDPERVIQYEALDDFGRVAVRAEVNTLIGLAIQVAYAERNLIRNGLESGGFRLHGDSE